MSDQIQPGQNQDDELDVEELEEASGGGLSSGLSPADQEDSNGSGCNGNCSC